MRLAPKFALLFLAVAAMPLAIAGISSWRLSQEALGEAIRGHERLVAEQAAEYVTSHVGHLRQTLDVETRVLDLSRARDTLPDPDVLARFLQLLYHQNDDFSAVMAFDEQGRKVAEPAFQDNPLAGSALNNHEAVRPEDVEEAARATPLQETLHLGFAVGGILRAGINGSAHLVLAVRYDPVPDEPATIIAALVSLRRLNDYVVGLSRPDREVLLLDRLSRVVAAGHQLKPPTLETKALPHTMAGTLPDRGWVATYKNGAHHMIGAFVPVPAFPLGVLVERQLDAALAPVRRLGWTTVYWMGVSGIFAAVVGAVLARSLARRVGALAGGARQIAQGKLETRLDVPSNDELGDLAKAFNAMTTSLAAARTEILRQTEEITAWNESLEKRVEGKTKELREAQDMLLRSRSLAAIGALGAGVAHEINNPLTGVLGLSQILLTDLPADHPMRPLVGDIEEQALRIQSIVSNLLRMAQRQAGEDFRVLDLGKTLDDALELCGPKSFADAGIEIVRKVPSPGPRIRGSAPQLQAAFIQLIQNARGAMPNGGKLVIESSRPEENLLRLRISDDGRGISAENLPRIFDPFFTTKTKRTDTGIGLSVVHKIIEDHGGSIRVESEEGRGTTFWLTFPIASGASHLA